MKNGIDNRYMIYQEMHISSLNVISRLPDMGRKVIQNIQTYLFSDIVSQ